jgi:hypothetical protein
MKRPCKCDFWGTIYKYMRYQQGETIGAGERSLGELEEM